MFGKFYFYSRKWSTQVFSHINVVNPSSNSIFLFVQRNLAFFSLETTSRKKIRLPGANRECRINLTSIFLSPLKKIAICKPYTCVFNGNVNFLRLSESQPTPTLCFYIMTRASQTSYCRSVIRILPFFLKICTLYQIKVPCFYLGILRV